MNTKKITTKNLKIGGIAVCAAAVLAMLPGASYAQQNKVTICHKGKTIEVAEPAVEAHLAHGDTVGPCDVTPSNNN